MACWCLLCGTPGHSGHLSGDLGLHWKLMLLVRTKWGENGQHSARTAKVVSDKTVGRLVADIPPTSPLPITFMLTALEAGFKGCAAHHSMLTALEAGPLSWRREGRRNARWRKRSSVIERSTDGNSPSRCDWKRHEGTAIDWVPRGHLRHLTDDCRMYGGSMYSQANVSSRCRSAEGASVA